MPGGTIRPSIDKFLADQRSGALLIRGRWGVGKTYFWRNLVKEATEARILKIPYAYVSLFGVNSLTEAKESLLISFSDPSKPQPGPLQKLWRDTKQTVPHFTSLMGVSLSVGFPLISDSLICLDDLERRGKDFEIDAIVGLISLLKEERGCKVVLILNESALDEEETEQFRRAAEKVFDVALEFSLSVKEAVGCVFSDKDLPLGLLSACERLGITNIRTIQRIERSLEDLGRLLQGLDPKTVEGIFNSLVLFIWSYNEGPDNAPALQYIEQYTPFVPLVNQKEKDARSVAWDMTLRSYGFQLPDELDREIIAGIQRGYFDETKMRGLVATMDNNVRREDNRDAFHKAWNKYTDSFDENEEEIVQDLVPSFLDHINILSLDNLEAVLFLLRSLGRDTVADSLVDSYLVAHSAHLGMLSDDTVIAGRRDPCLTRRLREEIGKNRTTKTLEDALSQILKGSWSPSDVEILDSYSTEDLYRFFKDHKSGNLISYIRKLLQFSGSEEPYRSIGLRAKEALLRIAGESSLNKARVKTIYGLDVSD